jgi:hypothetical protein
MPNPDLAELDVEKLERLESALAAERERRNFERLQAWLELGHRAERVITEPGETSDEALARARAAHPEAWIILRVIVDAPEVWPDPPPIEPVAPLPDPWAEHVERELSKPIRYPDRGWL